MKYKVLFVLALLSAQLSAQQLAFPGAVGFGRYAIGGRNGTVYHVTNLNDSGTGSLRDAVSQPNRIVVFDVAGVIKITERIVFSSNLTIAGQTAPGEGITVYGNGVSFSGASNVICRHIRFRMGGSGDDGKDAVGIANGYAMIFDHVSASWGIDEIFSISWDGKGTEPGDITIQNSIISQGLQTHSCGGLIQTDGGVTLYRNLYADNKTRNPKVKGLNQFVNNVVYNWGGGGGYILGDSEGTSWATIQNNYFVAGPSTSVSAYSRANANFQLFAAGNYVDGDLDGTLNGTLSVKDDYGPAFWVESTDYWAGVADTDMLKIPKMHPVIPNVLTAQEAYAWIADSAGVTLPARDEVDAFVVDELRSLGTKGDLLTSEMTLPTVGPGNVYGAPKAADTDNDGMPDVWEDANGTDKAVADAMVIGASGYANIERYINGIVKSPVFLKYPLTVMASRKATSEIDLTWVNEETNATNLVVEVGTSADAFAEKARVAGTATGVAVTGLNENTTYYFRLKAVNDQMESNYSAVYQVTTNSSAIPPVPCENPVPAIGGVLTEYKNIALSWTNATGIMGGILYYDVFFGTSADAMEQVAAGITAKSFTTAVLEQGTTYYWRVKTTNLLGGDEGTVWSFTTGQAINRTKLVYFPFDETSGTTVVDMVTSAVATATNFTPLWQQGKVGNSGYTAASPTNSYFLFAHNANLFLDTKSFTVSLWFKSPGGVADSYLLHKGMHDATNGGNGKWFGIQYKGTTLTWAVDDNITKTNLDITGLGGYFNDAWHHLACVRDVENDKLLVYVDGVKKGEKTDATNTGIGETGNLVIGNRNGYFDTPFKGNLDEVIVYEGALTATEISDLYLAPTTAVAKRPKALGFDVWPNPVDNRISFFITDVGSGEATVSVVDLAGKTWLTRTLSGDGTGKFTVDALSYLPQGVYTLAVQCSQQRYVGRFVKK